MGGKKNNFSVLISSNPSEAFVCVDQAFLHEAHVNWPLSLYILIVFFLFHWWLSYWSPFLNILTLVCCHDTEFSPQTSFLFPFTFAEFIHSSAFKCQIYIVSKICIPFLINFKFQNSAISNPHVVFPLECLVDISNVIGSKWIYAPQTYLHCAPYSNKWNLIYLIVKILGIFLDLHSSFSIDLIGKSWQLYLQNPSPIQQSLNNSTFNHPPIQTANPIRGLLQTKGLAHTLSPI